MADTQFVPRGANYSFSEDGNSVSITENPCTDEHLQGELTVTFSGDFAKATLTEKHLAASKLFNSFIENLSTNG